MTIQVLFHQSDKVRNCSALRMKKAIRLIAEDYGWQHGEISIALLSDEEIRELNAKHLQHDYATDVISFDLTSDDMTLEGEIIASVETADREANERGWDGDDELLLYVIHGMLHVIGLGDKKPKETAIMREAERYYLNAFGLSQPAA
jgi:probable rRNA maturation factor